MSNFIRRRELDFLLYEFAEIQTLFEHDRYAHMDRENVDAILTTAVRIAEDKFLSHAEKLDNNEPTWDGETVHIIPEVKEALDAFCEAGLMMGPIDFDHGGMQLPHTLSQAYMGVFHGTNASTAAYPLLTIAASNLIIAHGSDAQKSTWVEPMLDGRFLGTMCLSEPQAGSSLADITTKAEPDGDVYRLSGSKMWISGGEHELSDNIVHLVLAKLPDAPAGVKGISLFIVPRYLQDDDGRFTKPNDVTLAGLNHKMGYRGTVNCVLNFGDVDGAVGYLVGEPHQGLKYMFHMMNEARIGVGLCAAALGHAGFLYSLNYATERKQGRAATNRDPASEPVAIIEHTDVKRMLLAQKAYTEGALSLALYAARILDEIEVTDDEQVKKDKLNFLDFLTPIVKAWSSEYCVTANRHAIQILGGYGYTREYPVERLYRTNRLNPIHEGTNGIQSLDLLGRKVVMNDGQAVRTLMGEIQATCDAAPEDLKAFAEQLASTSQAWAATTMTVCGAAMQGKIDVFLANSWEYLEATGHLVIAWLWLKQAMACDGKHSAYYEGKRAACRYFFKHELPKVGPKLELLSSMDDTCLTVEPTQF